MTRIPPPPVPAGLRKALQDYPEVIQIIQDDLNDCVNEMVGRPTSPPPFEQAVWALEGRLGDLMQKADREAEAAEARSDAMAMARASTRAFVIGCTRSDAPWYGDHSEHSLWNYFQVHKEAFE
ncbi:MAG: hypothetical protein JO369_01395 [Paucibacter sp.]|nr:hypothetical protein [Roseateles sp.]